MLRCEVALYFVPFIIDVLWVALYLTVTHSNYGTSFPIESSSLQIGIVYIFLYSFEKCVSIFHSDVFIDVSLVSQIAKV